MWVFIVVVVVVIRLILKLFFVIVVVNESFKSVDTLRFRQQQQTLFSKLKNVMCVSQSYKYF